MSSQQPQNTRRAVPAANRDIDPPTPHRPHAPPTGPSTMHLPHRPHHSSTRSSTPLEAPRSARPSARGRLHSQRGVRGGVARTNSSGGESAYAPPDGWDPIIDPHKGLPPRRSLLRRQIASIEFKKEYRVMYEIYSGPGKRDVQAYLPTSYETQEAAQRDVQTVLRQFCAGYGTEGTDFEKETWRDKDGVKVWEAKSLVDGRFSRVWVELWHVTSKPAPEGARFPIFEEDLTLRIWDPERREAMQHRVFGI